MKKPYLKPLVAIELFTLTQSISSCVNIKINYIDALCVLNDPSATNEMRNWAFRKGFLGEACVIDMSGYQSNSICYHTSINSAFTS